jgi:UDP-N-acetylglucosamine 2-epimerase (non-hydrolysing)
VLVTCHRRESWQDGLRSIAAAVVELAADGLARFEVVLHPNPFVADSMRRMLAGVHGVELVEPCSHGELLQRLRDCDLALSDSGGIQEEAPALGVPLLVLRDKTERPEGVAAESARLVGTGRERIASEARRLLTDPVARHAMSRPSLPYGDGRAAERIADIVDDWLNVGSSARALG